MNDTTPEHIYRQAVEDFPFPNIQRTGYSHGELEGDEDDILEFCEGFTFTAGTLGNERIKAIGWIELYIEDHVNQITAMFDFVLEGVWKNKMLLQEGEALQGWYNLDTRKWSLEIGSNT